MDLPSPSLRSRRFLERFALLALLATGLLHAKEVAEPVAVFAQVYNGYKRTQLPDKSFKPETYAFGEGGCWSRPVKDATLEEMTFLRVAQAVAAPLARLNYRPARTSAETELMILVFWGSTEGSRGSDRSGTADQLSSASSTYSTAKGVDPAEFNPATAAAADAFDSALWQMGVANAERDRLDSRNAQILGYTEALDRARSVGHMSFARDIVSEVADSRYFVVLQAYDFKTAAKEKKLKPLWTARISMSESGNNFAQSLDAMLRNAARYFGQNSGGLLREVERETSVEIGPLKNLGPVREK